MSDSDSSQPSDSSPPSTASMSPSVSSLGDKLIKESGTYMGYDNKSTVPDMSGDKILKLVSDIQDIIKKDKRIAKMRMETPTKYFDTMIDKYPDFSSRYPAVFRMVLLQGDDMDTSRLRMMLKLFDKVNRKEITQHDASVKVGYSLTEKYLKDAPRKKN